MVQKFVISVLFFLILALSVFAGLNGFSSKEKELIYADSTRKYRIHIPAGYDENKKYPLIIALHDITSTPRLFELSSGFSKKADKLGFVVVYPYGNSKTKYSHKSWNAGFCCDYAYENEINDVGFIEALADEIIKYYSIDPERINLVGFSNGGMLANLAALRNPEKFNKIGVVAGAVGGLREKSEEFKYLKKSYVPIPVIIIHGKQDNAILFDGGIGNDGMEFTGAYDSVNFWLENNKCSKYPSKISKQSNFVMEHYSDCPENADVLFYAHNGGHNWPGGISDVIKNITNRGVNATELILQFIL